jgi:hypothetical protein
MPNVTEVRAHTWSELQEHLYDEAWRPELNRFRSPYAFRGINQVGYGLETSLARLGGNYRELERHLLRNFRKYARRNSVEHDTLWNWLALAKHHGLPTRLLDWSFSPFVALHFATSNAALYHKDGAIWAIKFVEAHGLLPEKLQHTLRDEGSGVFTVEMLAELMPEMEDLEGQGQQDFVLFFEPPSLDERIVNQFALFSMMSRADAALEPWLEQHPLMYKKIIIPAQLKWEVRDKLDQANINERVLFPGLDGLSQWLARHYSNRSEL